MSTINEIFRQISKQVKQEKEDKEYRDQINQQWRDQLAVKQKQIRENRIAELLKAANNTLSRLINQTNENSEFLDYLDWLMKNQAHHKCHFLIIGEPIVDTALNKQISVIIYADSVTDKTNFCLTNLQIKVGNFGDTPMIITDFNEINFYHEKNIDEILETIACPESLIRTLLEQYGAKPE